MQYTIKKPYKMVTNNAKKKFGIFNFYEIFRVIFEKVVFLKNGWGRHQMGAITHSFCIGCPQIQ